MLYIESRNCSIDKSESNKPNKVSIIHVQLHLWKCTCLTRSVCGCRTILVYNHSIQSYFSCARAMLSGHNFCDKIFWDILHLDCVVMQVQWRRATSSTGNISRKYNTINQKIWIHIKPLMYILLSYLCYTSLVPGTECKAIAIPVYQVRTSLTLWKSDNVCSIHSSWLQWLD